MNPVDLDRRFGGLKRLYGVEPAQRIAQSHVMVVGVGGVGSWAVEALARSGVHRLTLVDMDHVAESNINRQVHALDSTLGQAKIVAMAQRIEQINSHCVVDAVDDFVTPDNWQSLMADRASVDVVIDACDQVRAKHAMASWAIRTATPLITVGAAGGKRLPEKVEVGDLSAVTHDPLLAQLRYRLRKSADASKQAGRIGVECVFSREPVAGPDASCALEGDGSLNCHGYGSLVGVTATFGLVAATWAMNQMSKKQKI